MYIHLCRSSERLEDGIEFVLLELNLQMAVNKSKGAGEYGVGSFATVHLTVEPSLQS